ncbi:MULTISPECIES: MSMEG_4193 family putative phosphomutase [unclassified Crossiella]|uniref:MSMEG_4193 family putative phosphomutase n=1 Tax=unclassified Crossiella TaxID=2620835 RepID=UPI001FFFE061|nr:MULTISPECIES: MSMEG_4193 family putative phosphomutase [unclassified Crossiella]MCK2238922.1 MSMEG_4193 family putative phosphomutase [Crossiella sp. S99.2]MCK2251508.1 MSMEG_4193 family putative phosphomutase [Crossiella sp. S99.1]
MATLILLRHARSVANGSGTLAGRAEGVGLHEDGLAQAQGLVERFAGVPIAEIVSSPLQRCAETLAPLAAARELPPLAEPRLSEVDYGEWTGKAITDLLKEPLWKVVQQHPSAAVFPGGEGLAAVSARAVAAVREHDARISAAHGAEAIWVACSHGDVIKAILADALGSHLDAFQRILVDPGAASVIHYTEHRPYVWKVNDSGALAGLVRAERPSEDATVGGSTGGQTAPAETAPVG